MKRGALALYWSMPLSDCRPFSVGVQRQVSSGVSVRETFFYNQTRVRHNVVASRVSDFTIGKYTFEIGGKKKGKRQIEGIENGFIVRDDIETGHGIVVPLWHFGLLY